VKQPHLTSMDAKGMSCTSHYLTAKFNCMDNVYHPRTPPYYFGVDNVSTSGPPNLDNIEYHCTHALWLPFQWLDTPSFLIC